MKTVITIQDGRIEIQVDDQAPVLVQPTIAEKPVTSKSEFASTLPTAVVGQGGTINSYQKPIIIGESRMADRECVVCGKTYTPHAGLQKTCSPECVKEKNRRYAAERAKLQGKPPKPSGDVQYCKHCSAWTTHSSENHPPFTLDKPTPPVKVKKPEPLNPEPDFLPGHEKSPEELEAWKPKVTGVPTDSIETRPLAGEAKAVKTMLDKQRALFKDPWDCEMCRHAADICLMHEKMEAKGAIPPGGL